MPARRRALAISSSLSLLAVAALAAGSPAQAAAPTNRPFNPMVGDTPHVAVAPDGTGYVVATQYTTPGHIGQLGLCRIPRGARRCQLTHTFAAAGDGEFTFTEPYVFAPSATEVDVVADNLVDGQDQLRFWRSTDRGVTFDAGTVVGSLNPRGDLVRGPGAAVTGVSSLDTFGVHVQSVPVDGSNAAAPRAAINTNEGDSAVVVLADGSVLSASSATDVCPCGLTVQRAAPGANLNDPAAWSTVGAGADGDEARLTTGPAGTFLLTHIPIAGTWQVARWNPAALAFGRPVRITKSDDDNMMPLYETANGWVYALVQGADTLAGRPDVLYRSRDGVRWTHTTLASFSSSFDDEIAVAADGGGFAVHDQLSEATPVTVTPIPVPRSIAARSAGGHVAGKVLPAKARQPVQLQQRHGTKWVTVRSGGTNGAGAFSLPAPKATGTYRVIAAPVEGYAEADARPFAVTPPR